MASIAPAGNTPIVVASPDKPAQKVTPDAVSAGAAVATGTLDTLVSGPFVQMQTWKQTSKISYHEVFKELITGKRELTGLYQGVPAFWTSYVPTLFIAMPVEKRLKQHVGRDWSPTAKEFVPAFGAGVIGAMFWSNWAEQLMANQMQASSDKQRMSILQARDKVITRESLRFSNKLHRLGWLPSAQIPTAGWEQLLVKVATYRGLALRGCIATGTRDGAGMGFLLLPKKIESYMDAQFVTDHPWITWIATSVAPGVVGGFATTPFSALKNKIQTTGTGYFEAIRTISAEGPSAWFQGGSARMLSIVSFVLFVGGFREPFEKLSQAAYDKVVRE
jgi:hypothetical protein